MFEDILDVVMAHSNGGGLYLYVCTAHLSANPGIRTRHGPVRNATSEARTTRIPRPRRGPSQGAARANFVPSLVIIILYVQEVTSAVTGALFSTLSDCLEIRNPLEIVPLAGSRARSGIVRGTNTFGLWTSKKLPDLTLEKLVYPLKLE